jgi:hypothetical protein
MAPAQLQNGLQHLVDVDSADSVYNERYALP